jgi:GH18 family chitinase
MVLILVSNAAVSISIIASCINERIIDWEYPGRQAAGCNEFDAKNDAPNFLLLLKELRAALDQKFPKQHKEITMAVHVYPFQTDMGYMQSVKNFVPFFDHINIMSYGTNTPHWRYHKI